MRDTRPRCPHCNAEVPTPAEAYAHHPAIKPLEPGETAAALAEDDGDGEWVGPGGTIGLPRSEATAPFTPGDVAAAQREADDRAAAQNQGTTGA